MSRIYKRLKINFKYTPNSTINVSKIINKYKDKKDLKILLSLLNTQIVKVESPDLEITNNEIKCIYSLTFSKNKSYPDLYISFKDLISIYPESLLNDNTKMFSVIGKIGDYIYTSTDFRDKESIRHFKFISFSEEKDKKPSIYNIYKMRINKIYISTINKSIEYYPNEIFHAKIDASHSIDVKNIKFMKINHNFYDLYNKIIYEEFNNFDNKGGRSYNFIKEYEKRNKFLDIDWQYSNKLKDIIELCRYHYIKNHLTI